MEFKPTGIQKVHEQGARTESDYWRYVLQWERLSTGSAEVRAACVALLHGLLLRCNPCCSRAAASGELSSPVACSLWHVA